VLPAGVGAYTAAAIGSIVFEDKAAAVDGNVIRVVSRLRALAGGRQLPPDVGLHSWQQQQQQQQQEVANPCHSARQLAARPGPPVAPRLPLLQGTLASWAPFTASWRSSCWTSSGRAATTRR
jgi:hypothetical protein